MQAVALRVNAWLRRDKLRLVVTILLIGITAGVTMGIAAGARRTDTAPDRYTRRAGGDPDLVITQLSGHPLSEQVARLPGVVSIQSQVFVPSFLVSPLDGMPVLEPNAFAGDDQFNGTRIIEGRFTRPASPDEFTVNGPMASLLARRFGTRVGDRFQVVSFTQEQVAAGFESLDEPAVPPFTATLVGISQSPLEFDDSSPAMVFPPSFLRAHPEVGVVQTQIAVRLDGVDPAGVMDAVRQMPNGSDAYAVPLPVVSESARRAVRFQATALWLVTALSLVATVVVIVQVASRALSIGEDERRSMQALGWRQTDFAMEGLAEAVIMAVLAAPLAVTIAYALTSGFPLGVLRTLEPTPGARIEWRVSVIGVLLVVAVLVVTGVVVATRRIRAAVVHRDVGPIASWMSRRDAGMPLQVGARFALSGTSGRGPWTSLMAGAIGLAGLVGSVIVGQTLVTVVETPGRWGVSYDRVFGNPYTETDSDIVTPVAENPDVVAVTGANIGSLTINGSDTATIGFDNAKGHLFPIVLHGRPPTQVNEIGLGAEVARRLRVRIGDTVEGVGASGRARALVVVGIVVTPDSAGNGAAVPFSTYREMNPTATENLLFVDFGDAAPQSAVDSVAADNYTPPGAVVTPPSVKALERVTAAPFLLAAVLTLVLVTGSGYVLASSFRTRRRDLAILRALGSDSGQMRAVVHWQSTLAATIVVVPGVTLGIVLGRRVVALLINTLGIVPGADLEMLRIAAIGCVALLVANALALQPARRAARLGMAQLSLDR
ncbi:MAG TPA: FtsX-like permease family protein [Acidimicrobiales bacterium]|nr:FtsX-like permease family protein [Acidimicrobiales bacterium]